MTHSARFCVLGSNSYSGAAFVESLLKKGHPVTGISRSDEPHLAFLPYRWVTEAAHFSFHKFDINHDLDAIVALIERERPAYVVNFAAQSMVAESWLAPQHWFMTNVVSTITLHDRLRTMPFIERYVHVSTPEVYGSTEGMVREDALFSPSTPYAVSRAAADMSLRTFHAAYGMPVVFTRTANIFGPGQQLYRIIPRTLLYIRLGKKLHLHGGGVSERSFIHGTDAAEATYLVARKGENGQTYHISTGRVISIRKLVEAMCKLSGTRFDDVVEISEERLGKDAVYRLDSSKIRNELGWSDKISLEEGLTATSAWIDRHLDALSSMQLSYIHKP